jgi:hypothetical protein
VHFILYFELLRMRVLHIDAEQHHVRRAYQHLGDQQWPQPVLPQRRPQELTWGEAGPVARQAGQLPTVSTLRSVPWWHVCFFTGPSQPRAFTKLHA